MNGAEDLCGCLACAALCGVCSVAAAEEDKRERERAAAVAGGHLKNPLIQVQPVAVASPRTQKAYYEDYTRAQRDARQAEKKAVHAPISYY